MTAETDAPGPRVRTRSGFQVRVPDRGVVGLTGSNGTGKSVLLACATGVLRCPQVRAVWHLDAGAPPLLVSEHPETMVFEEQVADELRFAAVSRGGPGEEVDRDAAAMLTRLGLDPSTLARRRTWTLSSGEKRLVELVAALVAPAGLLALDEPTAGLDLLRREALGDLVRLRSRDSVVLLATQDLEWLASLDAEVHGIGN